MFLNEDYEVFDRINRYIVEAFSVSDDVREFTDRIISDGITKIKNTSITKDEETGLMQRDVRLREDFLGNTFNVYIKVTYCKDGEREKIIRNFPDKESTYSIYSSSTKFISVSFVSVSDKPSVLWFAGNSIQHEVNHVYQQIRKGGMYDYHKGDKGFIPHKSGSLYRLGHSWYGLKEPTLNAIGTILYLDCANEQDAFVNGLDNDLRNSDDLLNDETYTNTDTYQRYKSLIKSAEYCRNNRLSVEKALAEPAKKYNLVIPYDSLLKYADNAIWRFGKKIANVIIRNKEIAQIDRGARWEGNIGKIYQI